MDLKPCPFCGSLDIQVVRNGTNRQSCIVQCSDCGCSLESNEVGYGRQWNTRRCAACPSELLRLQAVNSNGTFYTYGDIEFTECEYFKKYLNETENENP